MPTSGGDLDALRHRVGRRGYALAGSGGHARSVAGAAAECGRVPWVVFDPAHRPDRERLDIGGADGVAVLPEAPVPQVDGWEIVIGVGVRPTRSDPGTEARRRLQQAYASAGWRPMTVVDPSAVMRGAPAFGAGVQVLAAVVIQPGVYVGDGAVLNTGARIDHDCRVGPYAFIGPGAILCGGVRIGSGAFVGAGAILLPGSEVGDGGVVPAGTVRRA